MQMYDVTRETGFNFFLKDFLCVDFCSRGGALHVVGKLGGSVQNASRFTIIQIKQIIILLIYISTLIYRTDFARNFRLFDYAVKIILFDPNSLHFRLAPYKGCFFSVPLRFNICFLGKKCSVIIYSNFNISSFTFIKTHFIILC